MYRDNYDYNIQQSSINSYISWAIVTLTIAVIGNIISLKIMCVSQVTGIITAIAVSIPALVLIISLFRSWYIKRNPWIMNFTFDSMNSRQAFYKKLIIKKGINSVFVRIQTKQSGSLGTIHFRPQIYHRLWWKAWMKQRDNDYSDIIDISDIKDVSPQHMFFPDGDLRFHTRNHDAGGWFADYSERIQISKGINSWYKLTIDAKKEWRGEIGFSGDINGIRKFTHNELEVINE